VKFVLLFFLVVKARTKLELRPAAFAGSLRSGAHWRRKVQEFIGPAQILTAKPYNMGAGGWRGQVGLAYSSAKMVTAAVVRGGLNWCAPAMW
jgi:hypothetical protein